MPHRPALAGALQPLVAQQAGNDRDEFLGLVTHELRTPLTSVLGLAELLVRRDPDLAPEERREVERQILRDARRIDALLANIHVLADLDTWEEESEPVLLQHLLEECVARHRRGHPERPISIEAATTLPPVAGQEAAITQVLQNLLNNAEKYSPPGNEIRIAATREGHEVAVRVLDRGRGITPEDAQAIFERFFRSEKDRAAVKGSGLGLAVCKRLLDLMGGRIWARPRDGGGSEFGFALPIAEESR